MKILMVCLGNICRSPLAEGIMKTKVRQHGLDWTVDSAGTGFWHIGDLPDPRSIATASRHGIDITDQRARQIKPDDLHEFDLVLAMDQSNFRDISLLANGDEARRGKVRLILEMAHGQRKDVPDPYYEQEDGFETVFRMLDSACERIVDQLKRHR